MTLDSVQVTDTTLLDWPELLGEVSSGCDTVACRTDTLAVGGESSERKIGSSRRPQSPRDKQCSTHLWHRALTAPLSESRPATILKRQRSRVWWGDGSSLERCHRRANLLYTSTVVGLMLEATTPSTSSPGLGERATKRWRRETHCRWRDGGGVLVDFDAEVDNNAGLVGVDVDGEVVRAAQRLLPTRPTVLVARILLITF